MLLATSRKLLPALLLAAISGEACTIMNTAIETGPNFRVQVQNQGVSARGLHLRLYGDNTLEVIADQKGVAEFRNVPAGHYYLSAARDAGIADGADIVVKSTAARQQVISLNWPTNQPIRVRSLKGVLRTANAKDQSPMPLDLLEATTGRILESGHANERGEFNLPPVRPGFYFLDIKRSGLIGILITPDAPIDTLDLDLGWSSCGLYYTEQSKCGPTEVTLHRLSGQVLDPAEGAIAGAAITVTDASGIAQANLNTGRDGRFSSPLSPPAGTYELLVRSPGFTPLRRTLKLQPEAPELPSVLTLHLGILGACGAAVAK